MAPDLASRPREWFTTDVKLAKGDIAHIDYDVWVLGAAEAKTLHDTTHAEVAKEAEKYDENRSYGPVPVVVGHDRVLKGVDEVLVGSAIGETKDVTIPPEKGAGERDPKLVRLIPMREFEKKDIVPETGLEVTIDGRRGVVTLVTRGRVRVDFNNPLAGRTLQYRVTVAKRAETPEEKVRAILDMDYGMGEQFRIFVKEEEADVFLPDVCKTDERWFVSKFRIIADLREFAGLPKVRFVEEYERKEEPKEEPAPEEAPEAEPKAEEVPQPAEEPAEEPEEPAPTPEPKAETRAKGTRRKKEEKPVEEERVEEELPPEEKAPEEL